MTVGAPSRLHRTVGAVCFGATLVAVGACRSTTRTEIVVSTAASLYDPFTEIARAYEAEHPGIDVVLNAGPTSRLIDAARHGARIDAIAVAGDLNDVAADISTNITTFASNELVIATGAETRERYQQLGDLTTAGTIALCSRAATCGVLADEVLASAGVDLDPSQVTRAGDARETTAALVSNDAAAALIYRSDAQSNQLRFAVLPEAPTTPYTAGVATSSTHGGPAQSFIAYLTTPPAQAVFAAAGFAPAAP